MVALERKIIEERARTLNAAGDTLKSHFVGIDNTIDELIHAMRVWYLMPEALMRPVIINLWGMTGVGKTDLVRRLVVALEMQDRFIEVELSNGDETKWFSSVSSVLSSNALNDPSPKIVLFDEVQRFRTLDTEGKPIQNTKFSDFWELLSDGRLSKRDRHDLEMQLAELSQAEREAERQKKGGDGDEDAFTLSSYEARRLKEILNAEELSIQDIMVMSRKELMRLLEEARVAKRVYEPVDHSKTLILVSGNLDEAFSMAMRTAEADVDADIFSAFTEKVTVVDIKEALTTRFKPEQVARFGNIHLIYRSLRRRDFEELIHREALRIASKIKDLFGIDVVISNAVEVLIYRNGVFPVQGVRPVFSSISDILEANLSNYVLDEMMGGAASIAVDYDEEGENLLATLSDGRTVQTPFVGRLDRARQNNLADVVANISVHEAGHAVAYAVLFRLAPLQLVSRVASTTVAGFTFPHEIHETRQSLLEKIQVFLAGGVAEEIVFGRAHASTGRLSDRERATGLALDFVRRYGFDDEFHANYALTEEYAMDKDVTDADVEKMMVRLESDAREILMNNRELLHDLSNALVDAGRLDANQVAALAKSHGLEVDVRPEGFQFVPAYAHQLDNARAE